MDQRTSGPTMLSSFPAVVLHRFLQSGNPTAGRCGNPGTHTFHTHGSLYTSLSATEMQELSLAERAMLWKGEIICLLNRGSTCVPNGNSCAQREIIVSVCGWRREGARVVFVDL